jgi:gluconokinase
VSQTTFVVMGVAGSGKTVVGTELARELGVAFVDGDDYHPPGNVKKMAAGLPLDDADRAGWLRSLASRIREAHDTGEGLVVACSALKRKYRDVLRAAAPDVRFVFLNGPKSLIAERLESRRGHYMPASMLESQLATLEPPVAEENAIAADITQTPRQIVSGLLGGAAR